MNYTMEKTDNIESLFTQQEVLRLLGIEYSFTNRQKLTYLRLGRKQWQLKRDGRSEYSYNWLPQLEQDTDWFYQRGKVYYTETGFEKIKDIFQNNKKIYIRGNSI